MPVRVTDIFICGIDDGFNVFCRAGTTAAFTYSITAMIQAALMPKGSTFQGDVYFEASCLILAFVCMGECFMGYAGCSLLCMCIPSAHVSLAYLHWRELLVSKHNG